MRNIRSSFRMNFKVILAVTFLLGLSIDSIAQSPKKYLKNGFYEQAFVEAVHKQNKRVKLKKKHTEVIYASYDIIYTKHSDFITSSDSDWQLSYNKFIRLTKFRAKVTHPGVYDNLKNVLNDQTSLGQLATKFNDGNQDDLAMAEHLENQGKFEKALVLYQLIEKRHIEAKPIKALADRLILIDYESKIQNANQKIGDKYILEATALLGEASEQSAIAAIDLIELARTFRPLNFEEEDLLKLANLIKGASWMEEAKKLLDTPTKNNARLAFELIERVRTVQTLTPGEERLSETAKDWGMTRILVSVQGVVPINTKESVSGFLNKAKSSKWVSFYYAKDETKIFDFEMEITENQPTVALGKRKKKVTQNTKTVEFWEPETDDQGNTTNVKKTRLAIAVVATLSRTKTATLTWSIILKDLSDGKAAYSETTDTKVEITNESASFVSGDILALPENTETDVDLDSQPFPSDKDMLNQVKQQYLHELNQLVNSRQFHLHNINSEIRQ